MNQRLASPSGACTAGRPRPSLSESRAVPSGVTLAESRFGIRFLHALLLPALLLSGMEPVHAKGELTPREIASHYPGLRPFLDWDGNSVHNAGNILLHVENSGIIGSAPGSRLPFETAPSAQWPAGSETEYLYVAGLWVGAIKEAEPAVSTAVFQREFRPGMTELDFVYATRELAPGGARRPAPNADDDGDGRIDEDWLDGRDNDDDGRIDEDFAAISNQMYFSEYSDVDPNIKLNLPEHRPLGFRIQQSSLAWEDRLIDDFIAFDFKLINDCEGFTGCPGSQPLFNVYVGFFADCDIGPREGEQISEDDWAGFWEGIQTARLGLQTKNVKISVGYMFDDDGDEGKSEGYIGLMFLGAKAPGSESEGTVSLRNFRFFSGSAAFEQGGDPSNDEERYRTLDGTAPKSLPPIPANCPTCLRPEQIAKKKDDYRMVVSAGPFPEIVEGDTLEFQAALVVGRFFEGMLENAVQAQLTYDGVYLDCDEDPQTGIFGRETAVCGPLQSGARRINPCDSLCDFAPPTDPNCYVQIPAEGCEWINGDCEIERQTGFPTGVDGRECLIHWLVSTAPPPPRMRLAGEEGRVDILWDNFSETTPDLRLNVLDFESYRIWRADNWTRPLGTDVNTGPGSNLWMLLAEFDQPRNNIGSDTGLDGIRYTPNISDDAVEFYREWFAAHPFLDPPDLPGFTSDQLDTAKALSRGVRYYRYSDPPLKKGGCLNNPDDPSDCVVGPCGSDGGCPTITTSRGPVATRCNSFGMCQEVAPSPHSGAHYFYAVTATDHKLDDTNNDGVLEPVGPGLAGDPSSNFIYINPPTNALVEQQFDNADQAIYVVPNPATPQSLSDWQLLPNNDDPTGIKVEFQHLPNKRGTVTIYTLSGDMVVELPFDGTQGDGTLAWNLLSRNGQEVTSGVYMFSVEADGFDRFIGRFVVIR